MAKMDRKNIGEPLGDPGNTGRGKAQPDGAGAEGGLGFFGDQRGNDEVRPDRPEPGTRPLDGTIDKEDIQGDDEAPAALHGAEQVWNGHRLNMEFRKREPLIIW
jgi:hypothetical protein